MSTFNIVTTNRLEGTLSHILKQTISKRKADEILSILNCSFNFKLIPLDQEFQFCTTLKYSS